MISKTSALIGLIAAIGVGCLAITPAGAKDKTEKQTIGGLVGAGPDVCPDGAFAQLDPGGTGKWKCLSLAELRHLLDPEKTVFVTSWSGDGDLVTEASDSSRFDPPYSGDDGLEAGDFICNALAKHPDAIVPPGDFVAWLSTSQVDARDRLTPGSGPFRTSTGDLVAKDITDLLDGLLVSPIDRDEFGAEVDGWVWTGTSWKGTVTLDGSCYDWSTAAPSTLANAGALGLMEFAEWTQRLETPCDTHSRGGFMGVYCFQR